MQSVRPGLWTSATGVAVNAGLALTKITAGVLGNSNALIADGIESSADVVGSVVVLGGLLYSARPPDDDHPFGHGKAESAAGLVVALSVLGAAALMAWSCVRAIATPHAPPAPFTLGVLGGIIILKESLYHWTRRIGDQLDSSAVRADAWHHRADALTSFAAFIGVAIALGAGPGWETADDWAALLATAVTVFNGLVLLRQPVSELMDASVDSNSLSTIRTAAANVPGVSGVGRCRVRKSGLELIVDLHLKVPGEISVTAGHAISHEVEARLRALPRPVNQISIHVEPADPQFPNLSPSDRPSPKPPGNP